MSKQEGLGMWLGVGSSPSVPEALGSSPSTPHTHQNRTKQKICLSAKHLGGGVKRIRSSKSFLVT